MITIISIQQKAKTLNQKNANHEQLHDVMSQKQDVSQFAELRLHKTHKPNNRKLFWFVIKLLMELISSSWNELPPATILNSGNNNQPQLKWKTTSQTFCTLIFFNENGREETMDLLS